MISLLKKKYRAGDSTSRLLLIGFVIYAVPYLLFYPKYYLVNDEHHYVRSAYLFSHGRLWVDDPLEGYHFISDGQRFFPRYPPGMGLWLSPFAWFGFDALFFAGLLLHGVGYLFFIRVLRLLKINVLAALFYLFYPPFVYYSATLFSDYPITVFLLVGAYFYLEGKGKSHVLSGVFFGVASLFKAHAVIFVLPFYLGALRKSKKKFVMMCLAFLPFVLFHAGYNWYVYGNVLSTGYSFFSSTKYGSSPFVLRALKDVFFKNLFNQLFLLVLIYPGLILGVFKTKIKEFNGTVFVSILFYSVITYTSVVVHVVDLFIIVPYRFLLPIIPLLLPGYFRLVDQVKKRIPFFKYVICFSLVLLVVLDAVLLASIHSASQRNRAVMSDVLDNTGKDSIIFGRNFSYLFNEFFSRRYISLDAKSESGSYLGHHLTSADLQAYVKNADFYVLSEGDENLTLKMGRKYESSFLPEFFKSFDVRIYAVEDKSAFIDRVCSDEAKICS